MPHQKLTQSLVDGLPFTDATTWYHDTELAGFNLSIGKQSKTFYAASETQGRFIRVKIGRSDLVRVAVARELPRDVAISTWTVRQLKRLHEIKSGGFWVFPSHSSKGYLLSLPTLIYKGQTWRPKDTRNEWDSIATEIGIPARAPSVEGVGGRVEVASGGLL